MNAAYWSFSTTGRGPVQCQRLLDSGLAASRGPGHDASGRGGSWRRAGGQAGRVMTGARNGGSAAGTGVRCGQLVVAWATRVRRVRMCGRTCRFADRVSWRMMSMVTSWDQRGLRVMRASRAAQAARISPEWASKSSAQTPARQMQPGAFADVGGADPHDEGDAAGSGVHAGFPADPLEAVPGVQAPGPAGQPAAGARAPAAKAVEAAAVMSRAAVMVRVAASQPVRLPSAASRVASVRQRQRAPAVLCRYRAARLSRM